jgi:GDPmannose 4,6-dehydratase
MSKKVIITGVSGQDGSHMADYLLENTDYEIYGVVRRLSVCNHGNLKEALKNPRFKLITGDLSDSQSIYKIVEKIVPDYFINLAAQSFVGSSWELPEQTMDVNATGTMRCLEAIVRFAPNCRFYNAGSSEEFGDVQYSPQDEKHPLRARSPYGASKIAARQVVKTYRESYNLYAIQGYLFNHEGPRRGEEFVTRKITKGVARINHALKSGRGVEGIGCAEITFEPIELGNLDSRRDWSHSKDFIEGIWRMLNQNWDFSYSLTKEGVEKEGKMTLEEIGKWHENEKRKLVKEYVLSSNETHSIREFIELAFKEAGIEGYWSGDRYLLPNYIIEENPEIKSYILAQVNPKFYRPADVEVLLGDSTLARKELGWTPKYSFQDLVREMVYEDIKNYSS